MLSPKPHPHAAPPPESIATSQSPSAPDTSAVSNSLSTNATSAPSDDVTAYVVEEITKRFGEAKKPIVLVDACAGRFGMGPTVRKLVESCSIRFFESGWISLGIA